ncbi:MAG: hypothetical protein QM675_06620 [Protaetiibacter sp.]
MIRSACARPAPREGQDGRAPGCRSTTSCRKAPWLCHRGLSRLPASPWEIVAFSFGLYGFIKKRVGAQVDAVSGLTLGTAWLAPVAIGQLVVTGATVGLSFGTAGAVHLLLMIATGVITATPLLLFASAARRLSLVALGLTQYLAPVLQFLTGVFLLHEPMPLGRWVGFLLVWAALVLLTADMVRAARAGRRASLPTA